MDVSIRSAWCPASRSRTRPDPGVTLVRDFLHVHFLEHVITDTHFANRGRLGRLITFVARLAQEEGDASITGLGIDQDTALVVDGNGKGTFYNRGKGHAWLVRPLRKPAMIVAGQPLTLGRFPLVGIGPDSSLDLNTFTVAHPAFVAEAEVTHGRLAVHGLPEPLRPELGDDD